MNSHVLPESTIPTPTSHRTVLLYEDLGTIDPGLSFALGLGAELGLDAGCPEHHTWLHMLDVPSVAKDLLREAKNSSYVVLSLRGDAELSPACREWIDEWLVSAPEDSAALIVLFHPAHSGSRPAEAIQNDLERIAAIAGVNTFFFTAEMENLHAEDALGVFADAAEEESAPSEWFIGALNDRIMSVA